RRRHTRWPRDWSSDVCSSDLAAGWSSRHDRPAVRPGAGPGDPRARRAWGDARVRGRRDRRGRAADGGDQGLGRGGTGVESRGPAAARHGRGGRRREPVLAPAVRPGRAARGAGAVRRAHRRGGGAGCERRARATRAAAGGGGSRVTARAGEAWTPEPPGTFVKEASARLVL